MNKIHYFDTVGNISISNGTVRLDMLVEEPQLTPPADVTPENNIGHEQTTRYAFAGRIVMPLSGLLHLHQMTGQITQELLQQGILQSD